MLYRTCTDADLDAVRKLIAGNVSGAAVTTTKPDRFADTLATGNYRPAWIRVADDGGRVAAAAVFWGMGGGDHALALDALVAASGLDDRETVWAELIRAEVASHPAEPLEYHVFLPGDWRADPAIGAELSVRLAAAAAAGLTEQRERFRYEWTPEMGVPARSARLEFRPEPDDAAWVRMFADVADGSLDVATRDEVGRLGTVGYAEADVALYKTFPGDRSWWRFAYDTDGDLVGCALPTRNNGGPVVGFLGILPRHRGHGYAADLLAEITVDLADLGAERIVADTDATNAPMAATFDRAGYRRFGIRLVVSPAA